MLQGDQACLKTGTSTRPANVIKKAPLV